MKLEIVEQDRGAGFMPTRNLDRDERSLLTLVDGLFPQLPAGLAEREVPVHGMAYFPRWACWILVTRARGGDAGPAGGRWTRTFSGEPEAAWDALTNTPPPWVTSAWTTSPTYAAGAGASVEAAAVVEAILRGHRFIEEPGLTDDSISQILSRLPRRIAETYLWSALPLIRPGGHRPCVVGSWPEGSGSELTHMRRVYDREWPSAKDAGGPAEVDNRDLQWLLKARDLDVITTSTAQNDAEFRELVHRLRPWHFGEFLGPLQGTQPDWLWPKILRERALEHLCREYPGQLLEQALGGGIPGRCMEEALEYLSQTAPFRECARQEVAQKRGKRPLGQAIHQALAGHLLTRQLFDGLDPQRVLDWLKFAGAPQSLLQEFQPITADEVAAWLSEGSEQSRAAIVRAHARITDPGQWAKLWATSWSRVAPEALAGYVWAWWRTESHATRDQLPAPPIRRWPSAWVRAVIEAGRNRREIDALCLGLARLGAIEFDAETKALLGVPQSVPALKGKSRTGEPTGWRSKLDNVGKYLLIIYSFLTTLLLVVLLILVNYSRTR